VTAAAPGGRGGDAAAAAIRGAMRPGGHGFGATERARDARGTLTRLLGTLRPHVPRLVLVAVCIVVSTVLGLIGPWLMGVALDRHVAGQDTAGLVRVAIVMAGAFVASGVVQAAASWLMAGLSQRVLQVLRADLFRHVQTLPMAFFERNASGDLMSRLTSDIDAINAAAAQNVTALLGSVLSMVGIVVAMFVLDARLALGSLLVVPIMLWFTRLIARFTRKGFQDLQRDLGRLNGVMEESIAGQRTVTTFRRNESVVRAFREHNEAAYRSGVHANTWALLLMPLTSILGTVFVIVLAGLGGWLALSGLVTVGVIATFITYGQSFVQPLRQVSNLWNTLQAALAGAERVFEVMDTPSEVDQGVGSLPARLQGRVRFEGVSFGYRPERRVLDDVSIEAEPGQLVALVGPTGAGKTTVINLLTRFHEIDAGTITIDGVDIRTVRKEELRRCLGLVLQETYLFGASVMENIRYGRLDATDEEVMEAARLADADHFIRQLPDGYGTVLSERAGNLSQGQRQLLAIARTLLARPAILILDEATSSVDTRTEVRIQTSLARLMKGRTSFVIAHRLRTIQGADQVLVIEAGKVVERGKHQELLARRGAYHRLYTAQFKGQAI
jgi:ATP-binding cassette subfamily B multidrug efflux pump